MIQRAFHFSTAAVTATCGAIWASRHYVESQCFHGKHDASQLPNHFDKNDMEKEVQRWAQYEHNLKYPLRFAIWKLTGLCAEPETATGPSLLLAKQTTSYDPADICLRRLNSARMLPKHQQLIIYNELPLVVSKNEYEAIEEVLLRPAWQIRT